jgi:hypothetical protein
MNARNESDRSRILRLELLARHRVSMAAMPPTKKKGFLVRVVGPGPGSPRGAARSEPPRPDRLAVCRAEMQLLRTRLDGRALFASLGFTRTSNR